ncbi:anti-sigma-factor antagonist [Haloferula helveola]|uniref:Anti-sigma-factor antagonist n=1 Tax=Haloferula helveola TaxID=490095 RepID=A0ABM7RRL5_9BACT|nr:anti-sigma-factor antagonist [Haloferula helveola]
MDKETGIKFGVLDGFTWIRCEGKGSFMQSPALKECTKQRQDEGEKYFVIDLQACTGMDSTFMGFLAGLSARVGRSDGWVHIASPGDRNRQSLEDLGLDCVLEISPPEAPWRGKADEIRQGLQPYVGKRLPGMSERARHVLEAHRTLANTNEDNAKKFAGVLQVLEKQASDDPETEG